MYTKGRSALVVFGLILHSYICTGEIKVSLQEATLSTNESVYDNWVIGRSIDGKTGHAVNCQCCAAMKMPTWLQLNLSQTYFVKRVVLKGRTDGAPEQLRSTTMFGGNADNHMVEQRVTSSSDTIRTYEISPPQAMQAIRVVGQQGPDYIVICEIEVYRQEDCMIGTYGSNCEQRCQCLDGPCDTFTGNCGAGCQSGWRGAACNQTCDNGSYGPDCLTQCGHCLNNVACNKTSGMCPDGCAAGYKGSLCKDACDNGWYGQGCLTQCGHCLNNAVCNKTSGVCPDGCAAGYKGLLCIYECEIDWYGPGCQNRCGNCKNKVPCDKISGVCPGDCEPCYYGTMCIDATEDKTTIELSHEGFVGAILAAIATGVVGSVGAVLCLRRHRRRQTSSSNKMETHQGTTGSAYDALSPTTTATSHYDKLTMTIPPTSSEQIPTAFKKVEELERLQLNQKTIAATYENLSPNLATEEQYERVESC